MTQEAMNSWTAEILFQTRWQMHLAVIWAHLSIYGSVTAWVIWAMWVICGHELGQTVLYQLYGLDSPKLLQPDFDMYYGM